MLIKESIGSLFSLKNLGIIFPCFYGIVLFIYSSDDISNPTTPIYFKIIKELILIAIIIKGFNKILNENKLSIKLLCFLSIWNLFVLYIIILNYLKGWTSISDFIFIKNYFFYISGLLYVYIYGSNFTEKYLRKILFLSILIGYYFMLSSNLSSSTFMYHGRSISTFLNPNFLGYVLALQFILIFFILKKNSIFLNFIFLSATLILLGTTKSISSILFILSLMIIFSFKINKVDFQTKNYSRFFLFLVIIILFIITFFTESSFSNKITYLMGLNEDSIVHSTSLEGRLLSFTSTWLLLTESFTSLLFGSNNVEMFEWDSGAINILYNYGVIGFLLWMLLFIYPILIGLNNFRIKPYVLSIFLLLSCIIFYSTQYVTQFYPTNFIISIIIGLILFSSDFNEFKNRNSA